MNSSFLRRLLCVSVLGVSLLTAATRSRADTASQQDSSGKWHGQKPNVLWILIEDWSTDLSCYGTPLVQTPNIDKLAAEGIRFNWAFTTAPVCSASRSAMMTGFHQNYIGAHQHRTADKKPLPYGIKPIPHLLEDAGYFTATMVGAKTDCNFTTERKLFVGTDWKDRAAGHPFYVQATFGGTHRAFVRDPQRPIDADQVKLPPYYPDVPLARRDWANGLESAQVVDRQVGQLLKRLDDDGLAENTIVFFIGDHGRCHIRGKQFLYDPGVRIPLIVRWPKHIQPGSVSNQLVSSLDICQTIVKLAGAKPAHELHGKYLFGDEVTQRKYVHFNRDKMDDTHDAMRAVRSERYKLIHNLMPERAYCQLNEYKEKQYPMLSLMNVLNMQGKLNAVQARFMAATKPEFELYDLQSDPHEIQNLADAPQLSAVKAELLAEIQRWRADVKDIGVTADFRQGGWSAKYPTKSLEGWHSELKEWEQALLIDGKANRGGAAGIKKPNKKAATNAQPAAVDRELRVVEGWRLYIDRSLLTQQRELTDRAVELLQGQLQKILRVVPKPALTELRKVPLYFSAEYPDKRPSAEFHSSANWLRSNGRDPVMAKAVEFTNIRIFEAETKRMPNFALHELAHAYHDRFLPQGFGNPKVKAAFDVAKTSGKYDRVERWFGNGKPMSFERAYGMNNPMEYFAEASEAFFSRNDFFPFTREELQRHDPEMYELLAELWDAEKQMPSGH